MNKNKIKKLILDLHYEKPFNVQKKAIKKLSKLNIEDIKYLIMPNNYKCWENAALVLLNINNEKLKYYINDLFNWIEDINWPGAKNILLILKDFDFKDIEKKINNIIINSIKERDDIKLFAIQELLNRRKDSYDLYNKLIQKIIKMDINYNWEILEKLIKI